MKVTINFSVNPALSDSKSNSEIRKILRTLPSRVNATRFNNGADYTIYNENGAPIGKMCINVD